MLTIYHSILIILKKITIILSNILSNFLINFLLGSDHSDGIGKLKPKKSLSWVSSTPLESHEYYLMKPINVQEIKPLADNYCGLPIHAIEFSPSALIYQSRKKSSTGSPIENPEEDTLVRKEKHLDLINEDEEVKAVKSTSSQRKVTQAILTYTSI
jgi:hypothetical protein